MRVQYYVCEKCPVSPWLKGAQKAEVGAGEKRYYAQIVFKNTVGKLLSVKKLNKVKLSNELRLQKTEECFRWGISCVFC